MSRGIVQNNPKSVPAFVRCPTKAYLLAIGEPAREHYFADVETTIKVMYKAAAKQQRNIGGNFSATLDFKELLRDPNNSADSHATSRASSLPLSLRSLPDAPLR